jgi:hypothetical protein
VGRFVVAMVMTVAVSAATAVTATAASVDSGWLRDRVCGVARRTSGNVRVRSFCETTAAQAPEQNDND